MRYGALVHETERSLSDLVGRGVPERSDSRDTRARLIAAVQQWVTAHDQAPARLADIADSAGVSTATAYRHFASVDDAIQAFVLQLPTRAVELFEQTGGRGADPVDSFQRWNQSWVNSCLEHGTLAVHFRSRVGFLKRRSNGDPVIEYACRHIEPLIEPLGNEPLIMLFTWNVISDPREVLELHQLGWTATQIADFVTRTVLTTPTPPAHLPA